VGLTTDNGLPQAPPLSSCWRADPLQPGDHALGNASLYKRLGGYDAISAVVGGLLPRLRQDPLLGHFWQHRAEDSLNRSKQHLIDFLCSHAGGPVYYSGRDMIATHRGMKISEANWGVFMAHLNGTLESFQVPQAEHDELVAFVEGTKSDMVES